MSRRNRTRGDVPAIEWITGLAGLAIVLGTLGFIGYEALRGGADAPALDVVVEHASEEPNGFVAVVRVRNESRQAAAEVLVEGTVRLADGRERRSQARLDYVPGLSTRRATLLFPAPPADGTVDVRILGYTTP